MNLKNEIKDLKQKELTCNAKIDLMLQNKCPVEETTPFLSNGKILISLDGFSYWYIDCQAQTSDVYY